MTAAIATNAELEALQQLEVRAAELREFLETLPANLKWEERFDELRDKCARLLDKMPRPTCDDRIKASWASTLQKLSELQQALAEKSSRARVVERYDELSRAYEQWLAAFRARAQALGMSSKVRVSTVKPLIRARTLFHIAMGCLGVGLYQFFLTQWQAILILYSLLAVVIGLEITRRVWTRWNHILLTSPVFHPIARPREYSNINSSSWYLAALCIVTPVFSKPACGAAVLILAFADPAAAWVGRRWGKRKLFRQKSYLGSLAFFVVGTIIASAFLLGLWSSIPTTRALVAAVVCALAATVAELVSSETVDDNFMVPVVGVLAASILI